MKHDHKIQRLGPALAIAVFSLLIPMVTMSFFFQHHIAQADGCSTCTEVNIPSSKLGIKSASHHIEINSQDYVSEKEKKYVLLPWLKDFNVTTSSIQYFYLMIFKGDSNLIEGSFRTFNGTLNLYPVPFNSTSWTINGYKNEVPPSMETQDGPIEVVAPIIGYHALYHIVIILQTLEEGRIFIGLTDNPTFDYYISVDANNYTKSISFESPLQQLKSGIVINDIHCNQGQKLIIKSEDGSPACVTPQTAQKLVERGWGKSIGS